MKVEIKAPSPGESISEVRIANWLKPNGSAVKEGENILELDSDKATLEVVAPASGQLNIQAEVGATVLVGASVAFVDTGASGTSVTAPIAIAKVETLATQTLSPAVRKIVEENHVNVSQISGTGKDLRVTKGDVLQHLQAVPQQSISKPQIIKAGERRVPMTNLRAKIAERLVQAQHTAAILTTFNEVDLLKVNALRKTHKDSFKAKHGVGLGYMSFFTRACVLALKDIPEINSYVDGTDVLYHDFMNVGVAVGSDRGLVVPVLRNAQSMSFSDIEKEISRLALKARDGKLSIADMSEGTFTISNGGTYGSMMSTPILNAPQSAILGMHKIMERPMVVDGKIEIRPMMYLALSYDHRVIDGKGAVTFLVKIKERLENPNDLGLDFL